MALVEASATTRAVCRECGSAIEAGEPRFGQDEDSSDGPRIRWRHLACAAQALPEALLRALELGGWQAVLDDEHDELRTLIDRAIAARRAPAKAMPEARAARSSSAMAAAAVLEPAHEAAALPLALARAWVFADALQARGDARGELLALELAAEHTDDPLQARALQREHHACWRALPATLPASAALRLRRLGGFVLGGYPKQRRELQRLLASPDAALLARVRLDFCTPEELSELVELANAHARALRAIDLISSRASDLQPLTELDQLEWLCVSDRFDPAVLAQLPRLRGLSVSSAEQLDSAELEPLAASLEVLELLDIDISRIDALGQQLPALARLNLVLVRFDGEPELLRGATSLRSLRLLGTPLRSLAPLASLPALRELIRRSAGMCASDSSDRGRAPPRTWSSAASGCPSSPA